MNNIPVPASNDARPESPFIRCSEFTANSTGNSRSSTRTSGPVLGVTSGVEAVVVPEADGLVGATAGVSVGVMFGVAVAELPQASDRASRQMAKAIAVQRLLANRLTGRRRSNSFPWFFRFVTGNPASNPAHKGLHKSESNVIPALLNSQAEPASSMPDQSAAEPHQILATTAPKQKLPSGVC
tara:strand:- start:19 stop:567 length:549 start_codon:yes stop_codon:yes gene_type:complete